jgi:hypothetical protein
MTRIGVVVGWDVPPAGSTVTPTRSPGCSPAASTGGVLPSVACGSNPADRIRGGPISQSWYTFASDSCGSPAAVKISLRWLVATTTVPVPPRVERAVRIRAPGAVRTAVIAVPCARALSSCRCALDSANPSTIAAARQAAAKATAIRGSQDWSAFGCGRSAAGGGS